MFDSTVPTSDYDDAVAELAASEEALASAEEQLADAEDALAAAQSASVALADELEALRTSKADVDQDLRATRGELTTLTDSEAALRARLGDAASLARLLGYLQMQGDIAFIEELIAEGFDPASADAVLAMLGETETYLEWLVSPRMWTGPSQAVAMVNDAVLQEAYERYLTAEVGSAAEAVAYVEFAFRLTELLVESVLEAQ